MRTVAVILSKLLTSTRLIGADKKCEYSQRAGGETETVTSVVWWMIRLLTDKSLPNF